MATVQLICFHIIEKHTSDRVVRQFGMIQEIPRDVDTDEVLHKIDLRWTSVLIGCGNMQGIYSTGVIALNGVLK